MTQMTIRDAVLRCLDEVGPGGISLDDLVLAVAKTHRSVRRSSVSNTVGDLNATGKAEIRAERRGLTSHYTLLSTAMEARPRRRLAVMSAVEPMQSPAALPAAISITAMLFGDPLPGRSALDHRRAAGL